MTTPVPLRLSRARGFDLQAHSRAQNGLAAEVVARPTALGNPYVVGRDGTRLECLWWCLCALDGLIVVSPGTFEAAKGYRALVEAAAPRLRLRNLACWCALPKPGEPDLCHRALLRAWVDHDTAEARREALAPLLAQMPTMRGISA